MSIARDNQKQMVHYCRKSLVFGDNGVARKVGEIPDGAVILPALSGIIVTTAFNAGTTNTLNIGTPADDNLYATLLALGTIGFVALDEAVSFLVAANTQIDATVVLTGTAASAGAGELILAYIPDNDL